MAIRVPEKSRLVRTSLLVAAALAAPAAARALTVEVRNDRGALVSNGFRWLLELDNSYGAVPGVRSPNAPLGAVPGDPSYTLGVNIHRSHAPTVCSGDTAPADATHPEPGWAGAPAAVEITPASCPGYDPARRYIVSVLPWHTSPAGTPFNATTGYTMGGRNVAAGDAAVQVVVHEFPVPTGQITVVVFADTQPINGAFDMPAEQGLPGFSLLVTDPAGQVMQDAFGNPLGTTYQYRYATPDGRPADASGSPLPQGAQPEFLLDGEGLPVVAWMGDGNVFTCPGGTKPPSQYTPYEMANCVDPYTLTPLAAGEAVIRFLTADKYTVEPVPPAGDTAWLLTATLEGTRGNDVWIRPTEPRFNITLGQLNWLAFFGHVKPMNALATVPNPTGAPLGSISGQVVYAHAAHPPLSPGLFPGLPVPNAYVGLNNLNGNDEQVYTAAADPATGAFTIAGVPPGTYQLVMWDQAIDAIIDFRTVTVGAGEAVALGPVAVYRWFASVVGTVFADADLDGFPDPGEPGIANVPVNLRFTDGSIYGSTTTGFDGGYNFSEYFPWWRFLVAEIDNLRFRPTGATFVVDDGGPLPANVWGAQGINPQIQSDGLPYRTELGYATITQAMNLYADSTARLDYGKAAWGPGENGGIGGMVVYATTRTEEDPATAAADPWEPGVPNVTVRLHKARQDLVNGDPISNHWVVDDASDPRFPLEAVSDSWNDNPPTGCVGTNPLWAVPEIVNGFAIPDCAETFHVYNQIRPGVFDGAWQFERMPDGSFIPPGNYIVEVVLPRGYQPVEWGDRNIEFGDPKIPYLQIPPPCVGPAYDVPPFHTLFPDQQVPTDIPGGWVNGVWTSPRAPSCTMKLVQLNPGANGAVDFHLFSPVPKAARIWGAVWNDLMLEFDPASPNAGGNFGVPWLPVAIKDWTGLEIARFYTDQWGHFDGLVPSMYDIVPPMPLGLALAMYTIAPNDPGPILDRDPASPTFGQTITDPRFNPLYSQEVIRENWEFYPGKTTFIDTIVLPVGAFVANRVPVSCDDADGAPQLRQVSDVVIPQTPGGYQITLTAVGHVQVPNPAYDPADPASPATLVRDHGFGPSGIVTVGGLPLANVIWAADGMSIRATVPNGVAGQLVVTRDDTHLATTMGVTLHAATSGLRVVTVSPPAPGCTGLACRVIQPAVDSAANGTLVVLRPGVYQENVNLWKPVSLQGHGARVTILDNTLATGNFALKQAQFAHLQALEANGTIALPPGSVGTIGAEQGAGIFVGGCDPAACPAGNDFSRGRALVDGVAVTGAAEGGGGILVNAYAANLKIGNADVYANQGGVGGGIRVGEANLVGPGNPTGSSFNPNLIVDHSRIAMNGSLFSGGGGIAIYAGADNYAVTSNLVCGNFSAQYGGGIGHYGLSRGGLIMNNRIVSNESFDEGGGIHVGGELPVAGATLSIGSGSVSILANLVQGNKAGDDGGGIRTRKVNGLDVASNPTNPNAWYEIDVFNNLVVGNSSADQGGGMAFDDTVKVYVVGDTIARNDSTSTGSDAFGGPCTENSPIGQLCPFAEGNGGLVSSIPQAAGIASIAHSGPLLAALSAPGSYCATNPAAAMCAGWSNPVLVADILWQNRSFWWDATANGGLGALQPPPASPQYWDLAIYGTPSPQTMSPTYSLLTDGVGATPSATNVVGADPLFIAPYLNVYQATSSGTAFGNFVVTTFTPTGLVGDYHIQSASPAVRAGGPIQYGLSSDYDGNARQAPVDAGGDQIPRRPDFTVTPTSLAFGSVAVGSTATRSVVVTNNTATSFVLTPSVSGAMFRLASRTGNQLIGPGRSITFSVAFSPTASGPRAGTLTIATTDTFMPAIPVPLAGTGL